MAKLGNSGGRNKGKKYKKLTGFEMATPESEAKAREFMEWYGANFEALKRELYYKGRFFDDEVATDTALIIYDAIALKFAKVESYKHYFFRAYHTNAVKKAQDEIRYAVEVKRIDDNAPSYEYDERGSDGKGAGKRRTFAERLHAPTFDYDTYEREVNAFSEEVLSYVRAKYPPYECSIFEIYIGLQPDTSYDKLSALLGISRTTVWQTIGAIRKDVGGEFKTRKDNLLMLTR